MIFDILSARLFNNDRLGIMNIGADMIVVILTKKWSPWYNGYRCWYDRWFFGNKNNRVGIMDIGALVGIMDISAGMILNILSARLFKNDRLGIMNIGAGMIVVILTKNWSPCYNGYRCWYTIVDILATIIIALEYLIQVLVGIMDKSAGMIFDILSAKLFKNDHVGIMDISVGIIYYQLYIWAYNYTN